MQDPEVRVSSEVEGDTTIEDPTEETTEDLIMIIKNQDTKVVLTISRQCMTKEHHTKNRSMIRETTMIHSKELQDQDLATDADKLVI